MHSQAPKVEGGLGALLFNVFLEFANLELDDGVVDIPRTVVFCKDFSGIGVTTFGGKPTGRLGDEPHPEENKRRREKLQTEREAECDLSFQLASAICDASGENGAGKENYTSQSTCQ